MIHPTYKKRIYENALYKESGPTLVDCNSCCKGFSVKGPSSKAFTAIKDKGWKIKLSLSKEDWSIFCPDCTKD